MLCQFSWQLFSVDSKYAFSVGLLVSRDQTAACFLGNASDWLSSIYAEAIMPLRGKFDLIRIILSIHVA